MLEELKALGVKELQVTNGQAVAVNPYEEWNKIVTEYIASVSPNPEWRKFNDLNLPPLPCSESVKEGRYSIDRFSEECQYKRSTSKKWLSLPYGFGVVAGIETRTIISLKKESNEWQSEAMREYEKRGLSEPVAESEWTLEDAMGLRNEVAEKPEGVERSAVPEEYPGKEYQELFDHLHDEHGLILLLSEMDDIILIVKKFLTANPKQY